MIAMRSDAASSQEGREGIAGPPSVRPGAGGNRDFQLDSIAVPDDDDRGGASDLRIADQPRELAAILDRRAVEADDDIARAKTGGVGRRITPHHLDQHTPRAWHAELPRHHGRQRRDFDVANRPSPHLPVLGEVADNPAGEVARDGEADSLVTAALAEDGGVDSHQLAAGV